MVKPSNLQTMKLSPRNSFGRLLELKTQVLPAKTKNGGTDIVLGVLESQIQQSGSRGSGSLRGRGQHDLQSEFQDSQDYTRTTDREGYRV